MLNEFKTKQTRNVGQSKGLPPPSQVQGALRIRAHQVWVPRPLEKVRFLLLSTNLARVWLQIDTDFLLIITSTADELSGGTNIDDLERP